MHDASAEAVADWKQQFKADKKGAKAAAKAGVQRQPAGTSPAAARSAAERAAAAAEQQVRLQRWRLVVAVAGVLVALLSALLGALLSL